MVDKVKEVICFFFQADDGVRVLVRSRGLGDVNKRQGDRNVMRLILVLVLAQVLGTLWGLSYSTASEWQARGGLHGADQALSLIHFRRCRLSTLGRFRWRTYY